MNRPTDQQRSIEIFLQNAKQKDEHTNKPRDQ